MPRSGPKPGSRPRPPRSCQQCSSRKLACDKIRPRCGRCAKAGLSCVYVGSTRSRSGSLRIIDETPTVAARQQLSSRLGNLGRMINDIQSSSEGETAVNVGQYGTPASDNRMPGGPSVLPSRPPMLPSGKTGLERSGPEDPGHLLLAPQSKAKYISSVHFAMISDEISEINDLVRTQQRYHIDSDTEGSEDELEPGSGYDPNRHIKNGLDGRRLVGDIFPQVPAWDTRSAYPDRGPDIRALIEDMPSRTQCIALIRAYLAGYHTVMPLFHSPSFWSQVRESYRLGQTTITESQISIPFITLYLAVLFAGSVVCPRAYIKQNFRDISREDLSSDLYKQAVRAIRISNFPREPSIQSLTAYIIVDTTWLRAEEPLICCSFVGVAVRVAQMLGLHKEPSKFPGLDSIDVHVRRQLWWNLFALDAQVAMASGLPAIITASSYDVEPVTELSESAISSPPVEGNATIREILQTFIAGRYEFYRRMGDMLQILHNNFLGESDLDKLLDIIKNIQIDLYARRELVTAVVQTSVTNGSPASGSAVFSKFTKMVISMMAAKPFAVIYGPVRRHGLLEKLKEKEPTHMMYCREYLHRFIRLTQCPDFQPWHWCWPGQHQPLYSIMALFQDLEDNPGDPSAAETRRLIDLAIWMCGPSPDEGILSSEDGDPDSRPLHEGGSETWAFIRRQRERVWEKAGADPSTLECPKSAKEIRFDGFPGQFDDIALPSEAVFEDNWIGPFPQLGQDWNTFFADFPSDWDFDMTL